MEGRFGERMRGRKEGRGKTERGKSKRNEERSTQELRKGKMQDFEERR